MQPVVSNPPIATIYRCEHGPRTGRHRYASGSGMSSARSGCEGLPGNRVHPAPAGARHSMAILN